MVSLETDRQYEVHAHAGQSVHPRPAVGVVVIEAGCLLLIQRSKEPYKGCWAVPGGKVRWGETLTEAAAREANEETGLIVDVGDVVWVGETLTPSADRPEKHNVLIDFRAGVLGGTLRPGSDAADAAFVPLDVARDLDLTPTMYELLDILEGAPAGDGEVRNGRQRHENNTRRAHGTGNRRTL